MYSSEDQKLQKIEQLWEHVRNLDDYSYLPDMRLEDENKRKDAERLDAEAKTSAEKFDEISKRWDSTPQGTEPLYSYIKKGFKRVQDRK